ncbi:MAG TPA: helix-turn-helix domain-containing protein [Anaerolineales bacterium]|jgi:AcrR family transcriptional regulator
MSTLRQRQAQATASMIVTAAKALFLEQGYSGTTIEAIAGRAEVAVSTVYAVFGSKRGILRAIRSPWHERSRIREVTYGDPGGATPKQRLEQLAQATRQQWESGVEVITIYNSAAASDPAAAAELNEALKGRRKGMETFALSLVPGLRQGMEPARASAILQALCLPEVYNELVRQSGWTAEAYQDWLLQALKRELLDEVE